MSSSEGTGAAFSGWSDLTRRVVREAALYVLDGRASHWERDEVMMLTGIDYDQLKMVVKELNTTTGDQHA